MNRAGQFEEARCRLRATFERIRQYAGHDASLARILSELHERDDLYARHLGAAMSKSERYAAYYLSHMRAADAKARRSPDAS